MDLNFVTNKKKYARYILEQLRIKPDQTVRLRSQVMLEQRTDDDECRATWATHSSSKHNT